MHDYQHIKKREGPGFLRVDLGGRRIIKKRGPTIVCYREYLMLQFSGEKGKKREEKN
jgi:hypothetical protein